MGDVGARKVLVGAALLEGKSTKQAMLAAGYSKWSANTPTQNGIRVEECVKAALAVDPANSPAKILALTRQLVRRKLDSIDDKELRNARLGEVARFHDVIEKHFGQREQSNEMQPRAFADRLLWMQRVLSAYQQGQAALEQAGPEQPFPQSELEP